MERITLNAEKREIKGKGAARSLRREGLIPGVVYRKGESMPIKMNSRELTKFVHSTAGEQVMVMLKLDGGESKLALVKDYQLDPVKGELLHTDFYEVSLTEEIKVTVHLTTKGEPVGVKRDGGILQHGIREILIQCLPDRIPGHITMDVSQLEIGNSIHVSDINIGEGIKILTDPDEVIASVIAPVTEEAAATETAEAIAEPEVIKKGKKEEAAGEKA